MIHKRRVVLWGRSVSHYALNGVIVRTQDSHADIGSVLNRGSHLVGQAARCMIAGDGVWRRTLNAEQMFSSYDGTTFTLHASA